MEYGDKLKCNLSPFLLKNVKLYGEKIINNAFYR